ncbi:MAG: Dabb family protein [Lachnoclostridium sp.]|nr:Dabb family protein [Lachnoclostridium sp.]
MVRHVILWDYADGFTKEQKEENGRKIKEGLENLIHHIDGLVSIKVHLNPMPSSNAEIMLDCLFESKEALERYTSHPEHVKAATEIVRPVTKNRKCMDFIQE